MKGIELTPSQIKAYENGATKFLFPIDIRIDKYSNLIVGDDNLGVCINGTPNFKLCIEKYAPIQKGVKDVFINEKTITCSNCNFEQTWIELEEIKSLQECPYCCHINEVIANSFSECIDVKVIKVQDIDLKIIDKFKLNCDWNRRYGGFVDMYYKQLKEQNIDRTYEDNDYVFLVEFKK